VQAIYSTASEAELTPDIPDFSALIAGEVVGFESGYAQISSFSRIGTDL